MHPPFSQVGHCPMNIQICSCAWWFLYFKCHLLPILQKLNIVPSLSERLSKWQSVLNLAFNFIPSCRLYLFHVQVLHSLVNDNMFRLGILVCINHSIRCTLKRLSAKVCKEYKLLKDFIFFLDKLILARKEDSRFSDCNLNQEILNNAVTHRIARNHREWTQKMGRIKQGCTAWIIAKNQATEPMVQTLLLPLPDTGCHTIFTSVNIVINTDVTGLPLLSLTAVPQLPLRTSLLLLT